LRTRRQRGFTLIEVMISMTIFAIFLAIAFTLTAEMRKWEKRLPVNFMRNPQIISVIARMRRDVLDVHPPAESDDTIYLEAHDGFVLGEKILIMQTQLPSGLQIIVWDFSQTGVVRRISYNVGVKSVWVARGIPPEFSVGVVFDSVTFEGRLDAVRLLVKDSNGRIAIDQILQPRAYE
jgi:prepilin-type N-terminal cleavage/methylation domain-containing protein